MALAAGAAPAVPTEEPAVEPDDAGDINLFRLIVAGGYLMVPIGLASAVMVALAIERAIALRRTKVIPRAFVEKMRELWRERPFAKERALEECSATGAPIARVFRAGIRRMGAPTAEVEKGIEDAGAREVSDMRRNLRAIRVVADVSPLMGLLGTVWGMIKAYSVVAQTGELGQARLMASGIKTALVTTAAGLVVAIPALIIYFYFVGKIDRYVLEMDELSIDLIEGIAGGADA
jgi:biopolymer transport protein ExbB